MSARVMHSSRGNIDVSKTSFFDAKPEVNIFKEHKVSLVKTPDTVKGGTLNHDERPRQPADRVSFVRSVVAKIRE